MGEATEDHGPGGESRGGKPPKHPGPRKKDAPIRERRLPPPVEDDQLIEQQVEEDSLPVKKRPPRTS
jgi:hypothetical protein